MVCSTGCKRSFAVCQSSEMFALSRKERFELTKYIVENTPKNMGVIASGHVATTLEEQIEEAKEIVDLGIDAYVFISNQFAKPDEGTDVVKKNIERLIQEIPAESFGIYECPVPYKRLISPELLRWCADTGRFHFLKDTCCDLDQLREKVQGVKNTELKIYNANATTLLESLKMGVAGYSGVMANFHGDLYQWLCDHYQREPEKAKVLQNFLGMASLIECHLYPINAKYHMQLEGVSMTIRSRLKEEALMTPSKKMEVEQFKAIVDTWKQRFGIQI